MDYKKNTAIDYYIWFIFFFPTFWGFMPNSGKTLGQLIFSLGAVFYAAILVFLKSRFKFPSTISKIFIVQCLWYILSITLNSLSFDSKISLKDFSDLSRPILYLIAISVPLSLNFKQSQLKYTISIFVWTSLACIIFDLIKFFPVGQIILKLYTALPPDSFNYMRFSGTFCYCYNYGFILIFPMFYCLYMYGHRLRNTILFIILLILTGSRSVLLATAITLLIYHFSSNEKFHSKILKAVLFAAIITILIWIISTIDIPVIQKVFSNFDKLITALSGEGNDGSLTTRNNQLEAVINNFIKSPIWGNGPLKESTAPIEMQLGYYLSAWGIGGLVILLTVYACCFYWSYRLRYNHDKTVRCFSRANLLWITASLIVGMSTPITDQVRVYQLFYLIQGIQYVLFINSTSKYKSMNSTAYENIECSYRRT